MKKLLVVFLFTLLHTHPIFAYSSPSIDSLENLLKTTQQDSTKVKMLKELCWQYRQYDFEKSLQYGRLGFDLAKATNQQREMSDIARFIGITYFQYWGYTEATRWYIESQRIAEKIGYDESVAFNYDNLGVVAFYRKQYDDAESYLKKALETFVKINQMRGVAYAKTHLSWVYRKQRKFKTAMNEAQEALRIREKFDKPYSVSNSLHDIALIEAEQNNYEEAIDLLKKAVAIAEEEKLDIVLADHCQALGECYRQNGNDDEAFFYTQKSLDIAQKLHHKRLTVENSYTLSKLYEKKKDYTNAYYYQGVYYQNKDSLFNTEVDNKTAQIEARYEFEKRTQELKKEQEIKDLATEHQIYTQRMAIYAFLVAFFIVMLVFYLIYINQKRIHRIAEQLKESNKMKDKLFSIIAHDLRSPLHTLQQFFELSENNYISEQEVKEMLPQFSKNVRYTSALLENLLYWARSQMQEASIVPVKLNLKNMLENSVALLQRQAEQKQIKIQHSVADTINVEVDKNMIELVIRNLLSNAIKFSKTGGNINVSVKKVKNFWEVCIADEGVGIPPENMDNIFQGFNYTMRGTANEKGTGLGLLLCKEFVEKNGGKIWVTSTNKEGSQFYFTLKSA